MKKYRPASWSQQAREMCDIQIEMVRRGYTTVEDVMKFFATSYRPDIIRQRAAKRFYRWLRKESKNG